MSRTLWQQFSRYAFALSQVEAKPKGGTYRAPHVYHPDIGHSGLPRSWLCEETTPHLGRATTYTDHQLQRRARGPAAAED